MKKINRLQLFELRTAVRTQYYFLRTVVRTALKGFLISVIVLLLFVGMDYCGSLFFGWFLKLLNNAREGSWMCSLADWLYKINNHVNILTDQLAYAITIAASVLGVLLGLYFTTFITIVSTKYANISSSIRIQLLEQKTINWYFQLLSGIISLSFLYQFLLVFGYHPTLISCLLLMLTVLAAIGSFVGFGKFSLIFFDSGFLVTELLEKARSEVAKIIKLKKEISQQGKGKNYLGTIYNYIDRVSLIINESKNPQLMNTSLDAVSDDLLEFAIGYNQIKYRIPSTEGWHLQAYEVKRWHQARDIDFNISSSSGVDLLPQLKDDVNLIEKKMIDTQFDLFDYYIKDETHVLSIFNQQKYLQVLAFQADSGLFRYFFERLEKFIHAQLANFKDGSERYRLQMASLYSNFAIHSFVGLNHNLKIFEPKLLKQFAKACQDGSETDQLMTLPYYLREWLDRYQAKLQMEKKLTGKTVTTLFYTEFELAFIINQRFQAYWLEILNFLLKAFPRVTKEFETAGYQLCALELNLELTEFNSKIRLYLQNTSDLVDRLNALNWQNDKPLQFENLAALQELNGRLKADFTAAIWRHGAKATFPDDDSLPDIRGRFYQLISEDIIQLVLQENPDPALIEQRLNQYNLACIEYIEVLRTKVSGQPNQTEALAVIYPLIRDLFEIQTMSIIIGKIYNPVIVDNFFKFWNQPALISREHTFWPLWFAVYDYYSQPSQSLRTPSYVKETMRERGLADFLERHGIIQKAQKKHGGMSYIETYETTEKDVYIRTMVNGMDPARGSNIRPDEVFVEFFLRTRISLKSLTIAETRYGAQLTRIMAGTP